MAFAAATIALGAAFLARAHAIRHARPRPPWRRLVVFEVAGFVLLEVVERAASGAGFADLVRVLPVGLAIQAAIAMALAAAAVALRRGGTPPAAVGAAREQPPRPAFVLRDPRPAARGRADRASAPLGGRAPPPSP